MLPKARSEKVVVQEVADQLLVYDLARHRTYQLNRTTALIWRHCDGRTTIGAMAVLLATELRTPVDRRLVWLALDQLEKAKLLQESLAWPAKAGLVSRRQAIASALAGMALLLLPSCKPVTAPAKAIAALEDEFKLQVRKQDEKTRKIEEKSVKVLFKFVKLADKENALNNKLERLDRKLAKREQKAGALMKKLEKLNRKRR